MSYTTERSSLAGEAFYSESAYIGSYQELVGAIVDYGSSSSSFSGQISPHVPETWSTNPGQHQLEPRPSQQGLVNSICPPLCMPKSDSLQRLQGPVLLTPPPALLFWAASPAPKQPRTFNYSPACDKVALAQEGTAAEDGARLPKVPSYTVVTGDMESEGAFRSAAINPKSPQVTRDPTESTSPAKYRSKPYARIGQACDRCKTRRIRCDSLPEGCHQCIKKNLECSVTDRLTGRTERRGYVEQLERRVARIEGEKVEMMNRIRELEGLL